uniref:Cytochrome c oxidase subunit NDUFA4 n=1 Tax=Vombatus ursinus TaxID=29139 RepID=A0A4X2LU08_VOMUR
MPAASFRMIFNQAKKHRSLIPLFVYIGVGETGATLYILHLVPFNPDVSWDRRNNPEPWNKMNPTDQYKFYSVNVDYSKLKKEDPLLPYLELNTYLSSSSPLLSGLLDFF